MVGVEAMGSWEGTKVTNSAGNLVQQVQEQTQNLAQQIQEQTLKSAGFLRGLTRLAQGPARGRRLPAPRTARPTPRISARQKAKELGVDLLEIEDSGAEGRITVKDVVGANQV